MPHVLTYGRAGAWRRRRRIAGGLAGCFLVVAFGFLAVKYGRPRVRHWAYLRAQQRCMGYTAPPEQVVYEQGPGVGGRPLAPGFTDPWSGRFEPVKGNAVAFVPPPWDAFMRGRPFLGDGRLPNLIGPEPGIAFMHRRATKSGIERLIVIALTCVPPQFQEKYAEVGTHQWVGHAASSGLTSQIAWTMETHFWLHVRPGEHLRVFAGQVDSQHASRFTIAYELDGVRGMIEGKFVDGVIDRHIDMGEDWCIDLDVVSGPLRGRRPPTN